MKNQRDIILVTGRNIVGKTTTIYHLQKYIDIGKVHRNIVTDSQYVFESIMNDDKSGGLHHTHGWCNKSNLGHRHESEENEPIFPFTMTDSTIPDIAFHLFLTALNRFPHANNKIHFVELAGGKNTLSKDEPGSDVDYSYTKIKKMYLDNIEYQTWLKRVRTVIHVTTDDKTRQALKNKRLMHYPKDIARDTASWLIDDRVLQFYGYDDFFEIRDLFSGSGVAIYDIHNDGSISFFEGLKDLASKMGF